ncbi:MAG: hypothetical protein EXQ56_12805, partial [Acidobacteria bacterium]|nr:hypothetical protein [Acidobacteriota bacterium]
NHQELFATRGRYFDLYTKQHGVEANLFLAPGEGDQTEIAGSEHASAHGAVREPGLFSRNQL